MLLFHTLLTDPSKAGHGREGYYWGASDEYKALDVANEVGRVLHKLGKIQKPESSEYTDEEFQKNWGGWRGVGGNGRVRSDRAFALGWKPKTGTKDLLANIEPEAKLVLGL